MVAGGYRWWYLDALSDDGRFGLTLIVFVGSVFSPYYAFARRLGAPDPEAYCAVNPILYGPRSKHWALTERGAGDLERSASALRVGPSEIRWEQGTLLADIREVTVPWPRRLHGRIRLQPLSVQPEQFSLDPDGLHHWWPAAPLCRVEVDFRRPQLRWQGTGYFDANWGDEALERGFSRWHWSRETAADGRVSVRYEAWPRRGPVQLLSRCFLPDGSDSALPPGDAVDLPVTPVWRMPRPARGSVPLAVAKTLEDTPFYSRSVLRGDGETVHESIDLDRFASPWVQCLLPFRMPRFPRRRRG